MVAWPQTFAAGRVTCMPAFASGLFPWPGYFPSAWILLCLLGPALTAPNLRSALLPLTRLLLLAPSVGTVLVATTDFGTGRSHTLDYSFFVVEYGLPALVAALAVVVLKDLVGAPWRPRWVCDARDVRTVQPGFPKPRG